MTAKPTADRLSAHAISRPTVVIWDQLRLQQFERSKPCR
jgi:hypothetical protein